MQRGKIVAKLIDQGHAFRAAVAAGLASDMAGMSGMLSPDESRLLVEKLEILRSKLDAARG